MHTFRRRHSNIELKSNRWYREQQRKKWISRSIASPIRFVHAQLVNQSRLIGRGRKERCTGCEAGSSSTFRSIPMMTRSLRHVVIATNQSSLDYARLAGNWNFDLKSGRQTNDTGWPYGTPSLLLSSIRLAERVMSSHPFAWTLSYFECWKFWMFESDLGLYISMHDCIW